MSIIINTMYEKDTHHKAIIDTIVTDVFQVLVHGDPGEPERRLASVVASKYGINAPENELGALLQTTQARYTSEFEGGSLSSQDIMAMRIAGLGIDNPTEQELSELCEAELVILRQTLKMYEEAPEALKIMKSTAQVVACSNCTKQSHKVLRELGAPDGAYSYQVGVTKPHRDMFYTALGIADTEPERYVMVEDTPENLRIAKELGMVCLLVGHADGTAGDSKDGAMLAKNEGWHYAKSIGKAATQLEILIKT